MVAIPTEDWSLDYIQPKPLCVRKDGKCVSGKFPTPPDSKKVRIHFLVVFSLMDGFKFKLSKESLFLLL